jgi:hypothetical protein
MTKQFRTSLKLALAVAAVAITPSALAVDATANSSATIMQPLAITVAEHLAFGKFGVGAGGSVTISTSGVRSSTGVVEMGGTTTAAKFDVTGEAGATYTISLAPTTLTSGANSMTYTTVSDLTGANATSGNPATGTLTGGTQSIYVGGVLTVAAAQAAGLYSGTLVATVQYN